MIWSAQDALKTRFTFVLTLSFVFAGFMSMKGGRGPAFDLWSRVLQRLQDEMHQFRFEGDTFEIDPEKHSVKHEQDIFLEILTEMTAAKQISSLDLDRCLYASGLWYEFRSEHTKRCGKIPPAVLNNNWIQGNENKIKRAVAHKHWFLKDDQRCAPWSVTMAQAVASFTQESSLERWFSFPLQFNEIISLESAFDRSSEKIFLNGKDRTPSHPFITGDAFRQLCPFRCEDQFGCAFSHSEVQPGDCIYIATSDLRSFETTAKYLRAYRDMLPHIQSPHAVITHNGDLSTPDGDAWHVPEGGEWSEEFSYLLESPTVVAWFASNCNWKGDRPKPKKLHCIPIGIENRYDEVGSKPEVYFDWMRRRHSSEASKMLLAAFRSSINTPLRNKAMSSLNATWITRFISSHSVEEPGPLSRKDYVRVVQDHYFVACPPGHGYDTHRLWEVLLAGSMPVVLSTPMDSMYEDLPILIVKDWAHVSKRLLQETLETFRKMRWNTRKIFFPWWRDLVTNISLVGTGTRAELGRPLHVGLQHPCSTMHDYVASARCVLSRIQASTRSKRMHGRLPMHVDRPFLLVMMGNRAFVPFVQSWLCNTADMDGVHERTLLLFTDDGQKDLESIDYSVAHVGDVSANLTNELSGGMKFGTYGYWRLVQLRVHVVASLLRAKIPFLLCEPDALWVQNPLHDPALQSTAEMVYFSDNEEIPGFGFMRLWPTPNIVSLFTTLEMHFGRQMPSPLTGVNTEIVVKPEQDLLYDLIMRPEMSDRIERLRPTKYVSGTWYAMETIHHGSREIHGDQVRSACQADGMPYVINNNWIVGNEAKIARAKRWGHWFLQNESAGTCRNSSVLHRQNADMLGTMQALPSHGADMQALLFQGDCEGCSGLLASLMCSILTSITFCIVRRCLAVSLPGWAEGAAMTSIFISALVFSGTLDSELGDMHSDPHRRRRYGISIYLSGKNDILQLREVLMIMCCMILVAASWRLWQMECTIRESFSEHSLRQAIRGGRTTMHLVVMFILFSALCLDAEYGDITTTRGDKSLLD